MKSISKLAKPIIKKYQLEKYGDYTFKRYSGKKGEFHGYTYSYVREDEKLDLFGLLSERSGFTIFKSTQEKIKF
ncbi:hypothetical protein [Clostridium sp.]|uniref:hypothetical protein n=1 Tax=Clostridium sp. TaxID=1506 RepID=UPI002630CF66|nr:hypothetical protein [uncultured Clostridium sp.]